MPGPRSLMAAFEACHPLRHPVSRSRYELFSRNLHHSRIHLYAEPSLSASEKAPNPKDHAPPLGPDAEETVIQPIEASSPSSSSSSSVSTSSSTSSSEPSSQPSKGPQSSSLRFPRAVQASYLRPLRHEPTHGLPVCSLQLRSFSVRNVEFMADFAMRAAYYLGLPAKGPTPIPKKIQRWTVPRANFVHKKSQENFERITLGRVVEIQDGEAEVVKIWLAYLRRYAFWGVGMKANIWEFEGVDVAENMDKAYKGIEQELNEKLSSFGWKSSVADRKSVSEWLRSQDRRLPGVPMMGLRKDSQTKAQPHKTESVY